MSWWIIHFWHVFERDAVVRPLCPVANLFCGCFCLGSCPFCVSGLLFLLTKRKSGWGICGSSGWFVWFLVCCDLPAFSDLLGPCTNDAFTAYAHVRTEPQCDIGHTRGKKRERWAMSFNGEYVFKTREFTYFLNIFFLTGALCLSAGRGVLRLTRLPRHDRGPVPGGNRSAASCLCTVLRRALYHYSTRSPVYVLPEQ